MGKAKRWTAEGSNFGCGELGKAGTLEEEGIGFGWVWIGFVLSIWAVGLGLIGFELGLFFRVGRGGLLL